MLRACARGANAAVGKNLWRTVQSRCSSTGQPSRAAKVVAASLLTVSGSVGGTILYAKWDHKFRAAVENNIPYSGWILRLALGPAPQDGGLPIKKQLVQHPSMMENRVTASNAKLENKVKDEAEPAELCTVLPQPTHRLEEASAEATHVIAAISEVPSVPAPCDTEAAVKEEYIGAEIPQTADLVPPTGNPLKERPVEEVAARLVQQDLEEQDTLTALSVSLEDSLACSAKATIQAIASQEAALQAVLQHTHKVKDAMEAEVPSQEKAGQWKELEGALAERTSAHKDARETLLKANDALANLRGLIDCSKELNIPGARPLILVAEENFHKMVVDLDKVITRVQSAESEAKIVSQYSELVKEAKQQFQREVSSLTPDIQANWKGLTGKLSADDLNALIAHAHRRIDQLNRELAEQRVQEQIHIDAALNQQKLEHQRTMETAVNTALQHIREEARLEQERKLAALREVMEAEMRTQLRRQAAAHTDHIQDVLKVQEQELRSEAEQVLNSKTLELETHYHQLSQEQLDNFTLDMNTAYARLKGMEEAIDSHVVAQVEARSAHQLWLSVETLSYALKTAKAETPTIPLETAAHAVRNSYGNNEFTLALTEALPEESLQRGVYSEASLRARFYSLRAMARRVALVDESHNSLYQYLLSYLQAALLFENKLEAPPAQLTSGDLDPFKLLSYASYCLEHGDLELAAKLVNQLRGEARRVLEDWLTEARLTLEARQVVSLLSAYANAVGLGTTEVP